MGQAVRSRAESMGMFNELAAVSAPESLCLNAIGLICFAAFALAAIGGIGGGTKLKGYRLIFNPQWSGIGLDHALGLTMTAVWFVTLGTKAGAGATLLASLY